MQIRTHNYLVNSVIPEEYLDFITDYGDKHITRVSKNFYKSPLIYPVLLVFGKINNTLVGLSMVANNPKLGACYAVTVVHENYREQGIATQLLKEKISNFPGNYTSQVAMDNHASNKLCKKVGLNVSLGPTRHRKNGEEYHTWLYSNQKIQTTKSNIQREGYEKLQSLINKIKGL